MKSQNALTLLLIVDLSHSIQHVQNKGGKKKNFKSAQIEPPGSTTCKLLFSSLSIFRPSR